MLAHKYNSIKHILNLNALPESVAFLAEEIATTTKADADALLTQAINITFTT